MEIDERLAAIEKRLRNLEEKLSVASSSHTSQEMLIANQSLFLSTVDSLSTEIELKGRPQFYIGAFPLNPLDLPTLFEGKGEPIVALFDSPPRVREDGFGLYNVDHRSQIVMGDTRRAKFGSQIRQVSRDGRFTALFKGGDDFLGWAMRPGMFGSAFDPEASPWRINSLVLAEATYDAVRLAKQLLQYGVPEARDIQYLMGYQNLSWHGTGPLLLKGKADRSMSTRPLVESSVGEVLASVTCASSESPERTSFRLIAHVYHVFGLTDEDVPYSAIGDEGRIIDPASF